MFLYSLLDSWIWYPTLFDTPVNTVRSVAIWLTIPLFIAYLVCLFYLKGEKRKVFVRAEFHKDSVVLSELSFMKGSACIAYNCSNCKKIIIDYADGSMDLNGEKVD